MSRLIRSSRKKLLSVRFFVIVAAVLSLCACSIPLSRKTLEQSESMAKPLLTTACPPRTRLENDTFGAWVLKAQELAEMYDKCRAAALRLAQ